jgi:glycolate oxidase iron-sulfur subunit
MSPDPAPLAARIATLADACVLCGLCLPHCPTYRLDRTESESPRGRIMLFKALAEQRLAPEPAGLTAIDHCLACRECERVCPAHVEYGALLQAGRRWQRERVRPSWRERAIEWLLPRPTAVRWALLAGNLVRGWLPGPWRRLPRAPTPNSVESRRSTTQPTRGRVALFAGCMGRHFESAALDAAARVLARLGYDVEIASTPTCCRAVQRHAGVGEDGVTLATRTGATEAPIALLTLASGCHESLAMGLAAQADAPPVRDLFDFLDGDAPSPRLRFRAARPGTRVALHLPCTQRNVLRNGARISTWLARIEGLDLVPLDGGCCGAAGSHMLLEPARAEALRAPLLDVAQTSGATTLCSSNVGCRMHLAVGLETRGVAMPLRHPIELLAEYLDD